MVRSLCLTAESTVQALHTGLKIFEHCNRSGACPFRLCQEGLPAILSALRKRVVRVGFADWRVLLANRTEAKPVDGFSEAFRVKTGRWRDG